MTGKQRLMNQVYVVETVTFLTEMLYAEAHYYSFQKDPCNSPHFTLFHLESGNLIKDKR